MGSNSHLNPGEEDIIDQRLREIISCLPPQVTIPNLLTPNYLTPENLIPNNGGPL